jgi:tripartite-type tricarboxylate transporter receptor subunit TctC
MRLGRRALAALALPGLARAAGFPERPLRIIVSFPPGGSSDLLARAVGKELATAWGQPVVADNRAGANGTIAGQLIASSPADGYTLGLVAIGHAVNPLLYRSLPYETDRDLVPLCLLATYPQVVLAAPSLPVRDMAGLLRLARERPLTYASGGNGSSQHLAGALLAHMAGVPMSHVPYRGGAPALLDVVAGTVDLILTQPPLSMLRNGEVRPLAVTSARRLPWLAELPTLGESGLPGYESVAWYGLVAPRGLPPEVQQRLADGIAHAVRGEAVREVVASQGGEPVGSTPAAFAAFIQAERQRYAAIVSDARMTND